MGTCNDLLLIVLQTFFFITFALVYNCQFLMNCRYYSKKSISSQEFTVVLAAQLIIPRIDNDNRKCKNIQCYLLYNRLNVESRALPILSLVTGKKSVNSVAVNLIGVNTRRYSIDNISMNVL